jgi:hypothetical protein
LALVVQAVQAVVVLMEQKVLTPFFQPLHLRVAVMEQVQSLKSEVQAVQAAAVL